MQLGVKNNVKDPAYVKYPSTDQTCFYPLSNPIELLICTLVNGIKLFCMGLLINLISIAKLIYILQISSI